MTLYRAMCQEEADATLAAGSQQFVRRWKWFSPDLSFVVGRVQDGRFNNSRFVPGRYTVLLAFDLSAGEEEFVICKREWALNRRRSHLVKWENTRLMGGNHEQHEG